MESSFAWWIDGPMIPAVLAADTAFSWWIDGGIILLFLGFVVWAGTYFHKWINSPDDFFVAGRQLTPFILAATLAATNINLYNFQSYSGYSYREGISVVWHEWTGLMALAFAGVFIVPVFRRLRVATIPEFLGLRYNDGLRGLIGFLWTVRLALWLSGVLYLGSLIGCTVAGYSDESLLYHSLIFLLGISTIILTMAGGMWAVALTDVLAFVCLLGGSLIMIPIVMQSVGYWSGMEQQLSSMGMESLLAFVPKEGLWNWKGVIGIWLLGMQWASTDQGMLQRAFSANSVKTLAKAMVLAGVIMVPFAFLIPMPGMAYGIQAATGEAAPLLNQDGALPAMLVSGIVPAGILGFVLCGLLASQISTIDSNLNSAATMFTQDLWRTFFKRDASPRQTVWVLRLLTFLIGAVMIAGSYLVREQKSAVDFYVSLIAVMDLPLFVVAVLFGLLSRRVTPAGGIAGYLGGMSFGLILTLRDTWLLTVTGLNGLATEFAQGVYGVYNYLPLFGEGVTLANAGGWDTAIIGMLVTAIIVVLVSAFTKQSHPENVEQVMRNRHIGAEEEQQKESFHIWPKSTAGRMWIIVMLIGLGGFIGGAVVGNYPAKSGYGIERIEMWRFRQASYLLEDQHMTAKLEKQREGTIADIETLATSEDMTGSKREKLADNTAQQMRGLMKQYLPIVKDHPQAYPSDTITELQGRIDNAEAGPGVALKENQYGGWVSIISMFVYFGGALIRLRYE